MVGNRELLSRATDTRVDLAIEKIIESARRSCGMPSSRAWYRRRLAELTSKAVRRGKAYKNITVALSIGTVIVPLMFAQLITSLSGPPKVVAFILAAVVIVPLVLVNILMPRTLADSVADADNLKFELLINRLAGQIALQNMIQTIGADQDRQTLDWLTGTIDPAVQRRCEGNWEEISEIIRHCHRWKDSMLSFGDLDLGFGLDRQLSDIAESIAQVARTIFNATQCTVKIYLQTTHRVAPPASGEPLQLLTAVGRFPPGKRGHWKSWIQCRGRDADVWQAFHRQEVLVFQRVKSVSENKVYPTIACMPLPDDVGVITIEANDPYTFMPLNAKDEVEGAPPEAEVRMPVPDHIVDEDLHRSLAVSVKELVLKAIRAEMARSGPAE